MAKAVCWLFPDGQGRQRGERTGLIAYLTITQSAYRADLVPLAGNSKVQTSYIGEPPRDIIVTILL